MASSSRRGARRDATASSASARAGPAAGADLEALVRELLELERFTERRERMLSRTQTRQLERQVRDNLRELVLEEPHSAQRSEPTADKPQGFGATSFGTVENGALATLSEGGEASECEGAPPLSGDIERLTGKPASTAERFFEEEAAAFRPP